MLGREPNLLFTTVMDDAIRHADLIFVSVNTPTKMTGIGAGKATDLSRLEAAIRNVARCAESDAIVVQKSTVPCGTAASMQDILRANAKPGVNLEVLSNPEFLAQGSAVSNLLHPDRIVVGHFDTDTGVAAARTLTDFYATWVPRDKIIIMNTESAELSKLAANALLAQRISSINALSAICESTGADVKAVSHACGLDSRIGPAMLNASVGFGGSCFKKDIMNLSHLSTRLNLPEIAGYWESIVEMNQYQQKRFVQGIVSKMQSSLSGKRVAVLGFAFKADTSDTRESPAIFVVKSFLIEKAIVAIYDPWVRDEQIYQDLNAEGPSENLQVCSSPYDACTNAHAIVVLTGYEIFSNTASSAGQLRCLKNIARRQRRTTGSSKTQTLSPYQAKYGSDLDRQQGCCSESIGTLSQDLDAVAMPHGDMIDANTINEDGHAAAEPKAMRQPSQDDSDRLDWTRVATLMQRPMYVFDGCSIVDAKKLILLGFHVYSIGSPTTAP